MTRKIKKKRKRSLLRKLHKWPSIVLCLFIILFAASGIVMNHRQLFSSVDVPRKYLPGEFQYSNWNNAAVKSAFEISKDSILLYGNIGIWLTDSTFSGFSDFNAGFDEGIDNRKIFKVHYTNSGHLLAGTLFGLFSYSFEEQHWEPVEIPVHDKRVVDIIQADDSIYVLTRSYLLTAFNSPNDLQFEKKIIPPPVGYNNKESLFKTLWVIHSGEIGGTIGLLFVDLLGLIFIFLSLTGIIYWLFPKWIKRRKKIDRGVTMQVKVNRFSVKWHNKVGVWLVIFLFVSALTGMFLRPPLLITIAYSKVSKIPYSMLDSENPWFDKLRRILYDEESATFLIGTNEGIFLTDNFYLQNPKPLINHPPLSVMGINVFEVVSIGNYLVGSFNGLFLWSPQKDQMINYLDPGTEVHLDRGGPPLSDNMTAGYIRMAGNEYAFDYNRGAEAIGVSKPFPDLPDHIIKDSPMSIWNLALEIHTGRIYKLFLGDFYILFIPLAGLTILLILVSGFNLWYRKKPS